MERRKLTLADVEALAAAAQVVERITAETGHVVQVHTLAPDRSGRVAIEGAHDLVVELGADPCEWHHIYRGKECRAASIGIVAGVDYRDVEVSS